MGSHRHDTTSRHGERGVTLVFFTLSLFLLIGMGALAIDLASMYVARNQSQQAADAAALAGAKYFVESGCVTSGNCAVYEATSIARATEVAAQSYAGGQPVTIVGTPTFNMNTPQNPQITVSVQSTNLKLYFLPALADLANILGAGTPPASQISVGGTATAEAWNPSGAPGGPIYCTGCVRPWLIPNCDQYITTGPSALSNLCTGANGAIPASQGYLLTRGSYGVENPGCYPAGVVGEPITMAFQDQPALFGAVDITNGTGNIATYQQAIPICAIGQQTCGTGIPFFILPASPVVAPAFAPAFALSTQMGVENLLHVTTIGLGVGQDYPTPGNPCPPQIQTGALNPMVTNVVVAQDRVIATSDSIVTAYIFDNAPLVPQSVPGTSQLVTIVGFAQIFVTQVDINATTGNTEVQGIILGVAGCGSITGGTCGLGSGNGTSINGPSLIPVRLITPSN